MYSITLIAITALAGLASAQSTISIFLPGADEQSLIASVVASDKTATTYSVACPPGADSNDCGFPTGILFTQGPATMAFTMAADLGISAGSTELLFTATVQCSLASASAVCTESYGGIEANDPGVSTTTVSGTDYSFAEVTLTNSIAPAQTIGPQTREASATKTSASGAKATGSSTLATSGIAKTGSVSGTAAAQSTGSSNQSGSASGTAAGQSTGTSSPSSSSSQAGAQAIITARPQAWIVGGAAVAWALL